MKRRDFHFDLPEALIAQYPPAERGDSRLLCLNRQSGEYQDSQFPRLPELLTEKDLLVFNNTRVIPARLFARKESGGKLEILLERVIDERSMLCQIRSSKTPKPDSVIVLEDGTQLILTQRQENFFRVQLGQESNETLLDKIQSLGHMPLPPYIKRSDESIDLDRYQTVYAKQAGAVAAPTAGLHFTEQMLETLKRKGVDSAFVTLHVGAGTFQPVRSEKLEDHKMHSEWFSLNETVCEKVYRTREDGGRVIAVGTTSVRCLESAAAENQTLSPYEGETDIFIYPGFQFNVVDALITNFHLPESTLVMLVSALAGSENVMRAYEHAVGESYRFFSYGDAMFIS
jgi:S-adenosylmethionine:tRNA ribosyltransferase-isomerase